MPSSKRASSFDLEGREKAALLAWTRGFGLELTDSHVLLLTLFLSELKEWNAKMNLVGPSSEPEVIRELLLDSLIP